MAKGNDDPRIYQALALPEQALENGGLEILRLGIIDDELYVSALPAFKDVGQWGEVLSEVARRLGAIYAAQSGGLKKRDVTIAIAEAFVADFGASPVRTKSKPRSATKKPAKKTARKKR
ncbi:MAG: hypothetical protein QOF09_316 [Alphaproteobacteria bacterium]|jgi:hypothetical protein|nr:hypothetical protein [Alphaproteobacteria bacterium]